MSVVGDEKPVSLRKGKYVFIGDLAEGQAEGASVPFFYAKGIFIGEVDGNLTGEVLPVNISDLILKQSEFLDENGKAVEAHKLYTWPRNLGSTEQWSACKKDFLNEFVMNFPIEVLGLRENNGVLWKFITPEVFKKIPEGIQGTKEFTEFAENKQEYFFLRKPVNEAK